MNDRPRDIDTPRGWVLRWTIAFACNLPVALLFGWGVTNSGGRFGMFLGIASAWIITGGLFGSHWLLRRIGLWGSAATACSQALMGMPQGIVGLSAMNFADSLGFKNQRFVENPVPGTGELWGLTATLGTAGVMCGAAFFFGVLCTGVLESWNPPPTRWTFAKPTGAGLGDFD